MTFVGKALWTANIEAVRNLYPVLQISGDVGAMASGDEHIQRSVGGTQVAVRDIANSQLGHGNNEIYPTSLFHQLHDILSIILHFLLST
jgi:hypothetical protein